ncbi:MAG: TonB-dependent receptor [Bacteroidetes bacterium]|nr:TonB-dependent receptor [Bacteroidota bacterium]
MAVHVPTGSQFGGITGTEGYFRLPNMNVGGPYKVTVSFVGYEAFEKSDIYLNLGQTFKLGVTLGETQLALEEVQVVGRRVGEYNIFDGNRTGAETVVSNEKISLMPTVGRDLSDFTRLTPQATTNGYGGISIAGMNNRYNAISIDGAVNNDVFGLAATGTNGGQTGGTPISMDAIEQFQIVLAPYDVRQGGFAGASINAVTRSGSNEVEGSVYYFMRNESISGLTPTDDTEIDRKKLDDFSSNTYGFRVGGPIVKNKLFFFVNAEIQREETPQPFNFADYEGESPQSADIDAVANLLRNTYGYEPGPYLNKTRTLDSDKFLVRLNWNINEQHKMTLRHSYTNLEALKATRSTAYSIGFLNNSEYFPSLTNSTALELKSNFEGASNNLVIGFTNVVDDRDPSGANFPAIRITDGSAYIYAGSEAYSTANMLKQKVLTITDNYTIYKGKHTITLGTSNEFSSSYNLFMRKNYGEYRYLSVADFLTVGTAVEVPAYQYERGYSLVDDITGDGSAAAADFKMMQFGLYAQDEYEVNENLKVTAGIRFDMPIFPTDPNVDEHFNTVTIPILETAGWDMQGSKAGQMPKAQIMVSPRIGFNLDVKGDETTQLRGGLGIFTSRLPLVWPGGSYTNNGVNIGGVYYRDYVSGIPKLFNPTWNNQYKAVDFGGTDAAYGGQVDLFAEDFKFPQMFRASLAVDQKLPWGMIGTLEGLYTKTVNNVTYFNLNRDPDADFYLTGADNRPHYNSNELDGDYVRFMLGANTSEGYSYNITAKLEKPFDNGLSATFAYTFGRAMAVNDGTSSQNSSQWLYMEQVNGLNNLDLSRSDFDMGHRIIAFVTYQKEYLKNLSTAISLYYNGQSGEVYSYIYNDYGNVNGNGESNNNLIYIPASSSEIVLTSGNWGELDEFINNNDYLSEHRGEYSERNGARNPFSSVVDLKFIQDIFVDAGGRKHTLQLTFDIFNLTNLINKDWGRMYYISNAAFPLLDFKGFDTDGTTPTFSFSKPDSDIWSIDDAGFNSSRWQAQIGIRYIF